jgi:plastocyanin
MRTISVVACAVAVLLSALGSPVFSQPGVAIQLFQFRPGRITVTSGTSVVFTNQDDIEHTVTSGTPDKPDGRFDTRLAGKQHTATVAVTEPGVYPYFCSRHPSMRGEIRVN